MTRFIITFAAVLFLSIFLSVPPTVSARENWITVRSKNFLLVGNDSEKKIREIAVRLEQFREVSATLFAAVNLKSPVPTTVVVFKDDSSFKPFKLTSSTAGYFQAGGDVNYITLTTQSRSGADPLRIVFHEYTHLLVNNAMGNVPTWFNEGLAEYYSTFAVNEDRQVILGRTVASHLYVLRSNQLLPLRTLFQVDRQSPYYDSRDKQGIFYAESWALVHYLVLGNSGRRLPQLSKFLQLIDGNRAQEQAFAEAFQTTLENLEGELREYVARDHYPQTANQFAGKLAGDSEMETASISEAEAQAYLGDLLLHSNRPEAEGYLQRALTLDPKLAMANASLGMLRARQRKLDEARLLLDRALAIDSQNYLIHYYYAYVLSREGMDEQQVVSEYAPKTAARIRSELDQTIALRPDFPESYNLLAFVNLVANSRLDESISMLERILTTSPGRKDLRFLLAQAHSRKGEYQTARQMLEPLTQVNNDPRLRQQAQDLLSQQTALEEQAARFALMKSTGELSGSELGAFRNGRPDEAAATDVSLDLNSAIQLALEPVLRKPEDGEKRVQGTLLSVECDVKGITFLVNVDDRLIRLHTDRFESVAKVTFSAEPGRMITCGTRKPENPVVICFVPNTDARAKFDGTIKSVEFVPKEFKLKV